MLTSRRAGIISKCQQDESQGRLRKLMIRDSVITNLAVDLQER